VLVAAAAAVLTAACGSTVPAALQGGAQAGMGVPSGGASAAGTGASGLGSDTGSGGTGGVGTTGLASASQRTAGSGGPPLPTVPAGSAPKGPVKVGILLTTVGQADALGYNIGNTFSEQQFDDAVIASLNSQGGLHGRKIVPVYAKTNTASTSWEADYSAACSKFTQDDHVDVVLGSSFAYFRSFESCLAKAGIPHLSNTTNVPDNAELAAFPLYRALIVPTIDKRSVAKLQGAINSGFLSPSNKLGVITDSCPGSQRAWNDVVKPFLAKHRITVGGTADEGCADGYNGSFSAAGAAVSNALLAFRSAGVDRITFITVSETGTMLVMSQGASSQGYHPGWIASSLVSSASLQGQAPADQLKNTRVYGWLPSQDVSPSLYGRPNAALKRCLALLSARGIKASSQADYSYAESICEALFAYEAALGRSGGDSEGRRLIAGLDAVGHSLQSVFVLDGAVRFSTAQRNDAPRIYREARWSDGCSCFMYAGPTYPMP
jgi:ABC-type branched-subunit amino acid transport system substrate-binding protein